MCRIHSLCANLMFLLAAGCQLPERGTEVRSLTKSNHCYTIPATTNLNLNAIFDSGGFKLPDSDVNSSEVNWLILNGDQHSFFNGVGRYGNCTGTLVDSSELSTAPAYVITNGHCVSTSLISATGVLLNQAEDSSKRMIFHYYKGFSTETVEIVRNKEITFASMDQTDAALVELNITLGELKSIGICPFSIAATKPSIQQKVQVVGVPLTGMNSSNYGLRLSNCQIGETVSVREGNYNFTESFRHRCSIVGGSSGSPVFETNTYSIVGLVNTAVEDSALNNENCTLSKPCEVSASGDISTNTDDNYGQTIEYLSGCFDETGVFNHQLSSCGVKEKFGI